MTSASSVWTLCDQVGTPADDLTVASGKSLTRSRNSYHEAVVTVGYRDQAAYTLWNLLDHGIPSLQITRNGVLVFNGELVPFTDFYDENTGSLQLIFRSGFAWLLGGPNYGPLTIQEYDYLNVEQTHIAFEFLTVAQDAWPTLPVGIGTITDTATPRTHTVQTGTSFGQILLDLAAYEGGFEFFDRPVLEGAIKSRIDIGPRVGIDRPDARFEYGPGTLNNLRTLSRTINLPVNNGFAMGADGLVAAAGDPDSVATYGWRPVGENRPEISDGDLLNARAGAITRPHISKIVEFAPELGIASTPRPFDDYDVGDTGRLFAQDGSLLECDPVSGGPLSVRLNSFTWVVDDDGNEATTIPDPEAPDEERHVNHLLRVVATHVEGGGDLSSEVILPPDITGAFQDLADRTQTLETLANSAEPGAAYGSMTGSGGALSVAGMNPVPFGAGAMTNVIGTQLAAVPVGGGRYGIGITPEAGRFEVWNLRVLMVLQPAIATRPLSVNTAFDGNFAQQAITQQGPVRCERNFEYGFSGPQAFPLELQVVDTAGNVFTTVTSWQITIFLTKTGSFPA